MTPSQQHTRRHSRGAGVGPMIVAGLFFAAITGLSFTGEIPQSALFVYFGLSVLTFAVYALDKAAAKYGWWRTAERVLQGLALLGGWPGAVFAQQLLRHKTRKRGFQSAFWIAAVINVAAFAWLVVSLNQPA